jgi:hypothetical protein
VPEIAEREPKVISDGHMHFVSYLLIWMISLCMCANSLLLLIEGKFIALMNTKNEKMVLFTPS